MFLDVPRSREATRRGPLGEPAGGPRPLPVETHDDTALDWAAVAAAFRAGDAPAADAVVRHVAPMVARLVRRLCAWAGDADDLAQDVLVAALAARRSFRGDARLETWITRIAVNRCRAHARKRLLRSKLFWRWAQRRPTATAPPSDVAAETNEQAARVRQAVAKLSAKHREVIVLCYLEGMTPAEAADVLDQSLGVVEVRLTRARKKLRELLGGTEL